MKRALIVEDVPETRSWLEGLVTGAFPGCLIDGEATMRGAVAAAESGRYDLALIDLGLPDGSGLDVLRKLKAVSPGTTAIVTTVMGDDAHIVGALAAGAEGYLLKETPPDLLQRQLVQLTHGIPAISPSVARRIMEHFRYTGPAAEADGELTGREKEVLTLIARGLRNADVAQALGLAESTVASHIKSIYRKLGIGSRAEAAWHATRLGLGQS